MHLRKTLYLKNMEFLRTDCRMNEMNTSEQSFTPLLVSTTTVTSIFKCSINIIDIAKYLPLDDAIIGIKLVYAGGTSSIIRGVAKMSKKKKDFYNQVTFTIRLPINTFGNSRLEDKTSILASCKIFHNGTLHVTGTRTLEEATNASNLLLHRLRNFTRYENDFVGRKDAFPGYSRQSVV